MTASQERAARSKVMDALAALPIYHQSLPLADIDAILTANGFKPLEEGIYCGHQGRINDQVGEFSYLVMSWYRMPSGRFEINAYIS